MSAVSLPHFPSCPRHCPDPSWLFSHMHAQHMSLRPPPPWPRQHTALPAVSKPLHSLPSCGTFQTVPSGVSAPAGLPTRPLMALMQGLSYVSLVTLLQLNCDPDLEQCLPCSGVGIRAAWRGAGLRNDPVSESAATGPGVVVLVILSYWGFVSCQ